MTIALNWTDVAAFDDLWDGAGVPLHMAGREFALFRVSAAVYATDGICTHGHARLCEGFIEGTDIECPLHQGRFDLRTGAPTCAPAAEALRTYPVRVVDGRVQLSLD